jgi:hypothetical protein
MDFTEFTTFGIISIIGWIIVGIRVMRVCDASGVGNGWFAFIPVLNFTRWARLARMSPWLVLLFLIPLVGQIILIIFELIWLNKISEQTNTKSPWFWIFLILALGGWGLIGLFSGALFVVAAMIVTIVMIAAQWMIFDPTKPIAGVADNS